MTEKGVPLKSVEEKLRAIEKASRYDFPTANIAVMLQEIEEGGKRSGYPE